MSSSSNRDLERRLVQAASKPEAPADLHEFIDQIPARAADLARRYPQPATPSAVRRRRLTLALVAAAAVIVAVAGSSVITGFREAAQTGPSGPRTQGATAATQASTSPDFTTGSWGWWRIAGTRPATIARVANGYVGACVSDGVPAVCTSRDGIRWTLPADPAVFVASAAEPRFTGWRIAHAGRNWVAASPIDGSAWRSTDGLHWQPIALPLSGVTKADVQPLGDGFALLATHSGGQIAATVLTSRDGVTWASHTVPVGTYAEGLGGAAGLVAYASDGSGSLDGQSVWVSSDGSSWRRATFAARPSLGAVYSLPGGGFIGWTPPGAGVTPSLQRSTDGVVWTLDPGPGQRVESFVFTGTRFLAVAQVPGTDQLALFESADAKAWTRVSVLAGTPLDGGSLVSAGALVALVTEGRLAAIGAPLEGSVPTVTPTPTPARASPPPDVTFIAGGWRWHALSTVPDYAPVKLANGYLASCGKSLCTSPNGWSWTSPPDPSIFSTPEPVHFVPTSVAHRPGGNWVITAGSGVWYSTDGVRWQVGQVPGQTIDVVLASAEGFGAMVYTSDMVDYVFQSDNGATWTRSDLKDPVYMQPEIGVAAGWLPNVGAKFHWRYTADGRHWIVATLPSDVFPNGTPKRLSTGQLVVAAGERILVSSDGARWIAPGAAMDFSGIAVVGDRIVRNVSGPPAGVVESADAGKTFHPILPGARSEQFGDLLKVTLADGSQWVGAPLTSQEAAVTSPSPTQPAVVVTPPPSPTPEPTPSGGISHDRAIEIAIGALGGSVDPTTATATAERDRFSGRWIWSVSTRDPGAQSGHVVDIDFFTGEVIRTGSWIT